MLAKSKNRAELKRCILALFFKKSWIYANQLNPDRIFILSDKHHLLDPEKAIDTYNETLYKFPAHKRKAWAQTVLQELRSAGIDPEHDEFILLAGEKYYEYLLGEDGIRNFTLPLKGRGGIGCILKYLNEQITQL